MGNWIVNKNKAHKRLTTLSATAQTDGLGWVLFKTNKPGAAADFNEGIMKKLYDELCLKEGASEDQIKCNYRKLAKQYHPDAAGENFNKEKWERILHAYETLSDPEKRAHYDQTGDEQKTNQKSVEDMAVDILIEGINEATNHVINKQEYNFDLVESIKIHISKRKEATETDIKNMKKALRSLWMFKQKFVKTEGRTQVMISVVKEKISQIRAQKVQAEGFIGVLDKAAELMLMVEFEYTPEEIDEFLGVGSASGSASMFYQTFRTQGP